MTEAKAIRNLLDAWQKVDLARDFVQLDAQITVTKQLLRSNRNWTKLSDTLRDILLAYEHI